MKLSRNLVFIRLIAFASCIGICSIAMASVESGGDDSRVNETPLEYNQLVARLEIINEEIEMLRSDIEQRHRHFVEAPNPENQNSLNHEDILKYRSEVMRERYADLVDLEQMESNLIRLESQRADLIDEMTEAGSYGEEALVLDPQAAAIKNVNQRIKHSDANQLKRGDK